MRYAQRTDVTVEKTRAEIEATLNRYGADAFAYMTEPGSAKIGFRAHDRHIRFMLPLPDREEFRRVTKRLRSGRPKHVERTDLQTYKAWEQACRQRWRALSLAIKAKLEAVESGIATFEDEFLAYVVLPSGETMGAWARPQLVRALQNGAALPPLLDYTPAQGGAS